MKTINDLYKFCEKNEYEIILRAGTFKGFMKVEKPHIQDIFQELGICRI